MSKATSLNRTRRLSKASATGVLGEYKHAVTFRDDGDFAIIFGPNGVGKTRFLEIIDALSNLKISRLESLPFDSAMLQFTDGWTLMVSHETTVMKDLSESEPDNLSFTLTWNELIKHHGAEIEGQAVDTLLFQLMDPSGAQRAVHSILVRQPEVDLSARDRALSRPQDWNEDFTVSSELLRLIRSNERRGRSGPRKLPEEFEAFTKSLDVRLIETQRLLTHGVEDKAGRRERTSRPTIEAYSDIVRQQLETDLSNNSRVGQRLDSTFPSRMLEAGESSRTTEEEIRTRLEDQRTRRARIEQITPLGLGAAIPLPEGSLTDAQRSVLELYLGDADEKLATFASTIEKIDMLEGTINARLLGKQLRISAEDGIVIQRDRDGERIPLTALSSGEQHEIILIFDLLFNVKRGGLVLIDEPEISLHIAWQQHFIADVLKIARLVGFQFVIATHSPQIIENFWPQAQRLGPATAPFEGRDQTLRDA